MYELLKQLGFVTIGSVSVVGLIGYLAKRIFEKYLAARIDTHKAELNKEVELYRMALSNEAHKFQTKFSTLHAERVELTRELYKKLSTFHGKLKSAFIHANLIPPPELGDPLESKLSQELSSSYMELSTFFEVNRIMFSDKIAEKLGKITSSYVEHEFLHQKVRIYEHMQQHDKSDELKNEVEKKYKELYDIHNSRIPGVLKDIENEFRELLGVDI